MRLALLVLTFVLASTTPALAQGVRGQGFMFDLRAGGGALYDDTASPAVTYGLGAAFALDRAATFAIGGELDGFASWMRGIRRDRAAVLATFQVWFTEYVSLKLGAGTPVGPAAIGEGFAGFARVGYELRRWHRNALVLSLDVNEDTTAGPQVNVQIGFEIFTHEKTWNLWHPK